MNGEDLFVKGGSFPREKAGQQQGTLKNGDRKVQLHSANGCCRWFLNFFFLRPHELIQAVI